MMPPKHMDIGKIIGHILAGEIAIGYGLSEVIDILSTSLMDLVSFSGLGLFLLMILGLRFLVAGLCGVLKSRSAAYEQQDEMINLGDLHLTEEQLFQISYLKLWRVRTLLQLKRLSRLARSSIFAKFIRKYFKKAQLASKSKAYKTLVTKAKPKIAKKSLEKKAKLQKKVAAKAKMASKSAAKGAKKSSAKKNPYIAGQEKSAIKKLRAVIKSAQKASSALNAKIFGAFTVAAGKQAAKEFLYAEKALLKKQQKYYQKSASIKMKAALKSQYTLKSKSSSHSPSAGKTATVHA